MKRIRAIVWPAAALLAFFLAACDVEKQMDTMVDNPSFAEPLFTKFMAKPEYQLKAMDALLTDAAMRQTLLEKITASPEWSRAAAEQLLADPGTRALVAEMLAAQPQPPPGEQRAAKPAS